MAEEGIKFIFGRSIVAANVQAYQLGHGGIRRDLCRSFALGFGLTEDNGDSVYTQIRNNQKINQTVGFGSSSIYDGYETLFKTRLSSAYPSLNEYQVGIYALIANAILFGYSFNTNTSLSVVSTYIGKVMVEAQIITNTNPFEIVEQTIIHPFTKDVLKQILASANYGLVFSAIQSSERAAELPMVNYNWYDTSGVFAGPNLQLMKDCENQYYYLSGQLTYNDVPQNLPPCEEETMLINTSSGVRQITRFKSVPCQDDDNYIGPPRGVNFYRVFNDGPYSSGDFTSQTRSSFIGFDKEILTGTEYQNNARVIYTYEDGKICEMPAFFDANGRIDFGKEYENSPASTGCYPKYQVMRVGDNRIRALITGCNEYNGLGECIDPVCGEVAATGFKFVGLELNTGIWGSRFRDIDTNLVSTMDGFSKRALNLNSSAYTATEKDGALNTFTKDFMDNEIWYAGPPQLNGHNVLPYLAFHQNFDSPTFNKYANVTIYAAIGTSAGETSNSDASRSWELSPLVVASGQDTDHLVAGETGIHAKARFTSTIHSTTGKNDDVLFKVLGMGNGLGGQYSILSALEENAGYLYTGYMVSGAAGVKNSQELIEEYSDFIIGSQLKLTRFISGYTGLNTLGVSKMFAKDESGKQYEYYYFDDRKNPVNTTQTGWTSFAPLPTEIDEDPLYSRVYATQRNENYFPRFYKGPYAFVDKKILYPNADFSKSIYPISNGFPRKVRFKLKVREEAIKEVYSRFLISDGAVSNTAEFVNVVRPYDFGYELGKLANTFTSKGVLTDFNMWAVDNYGFNAYSGLNLVDNAWAPVFENIPIGFTSFPAWSSGRNGVVYTNTPTFQQGILMTGTTSHAVKQYISTGGGNMIYSQHQNAGAGLLHCYTGRTITGEFQYVKPVFSLESGIIVPEDALKVMPLMGKNPIEGGPKDADVSYFNGCISTGQAGQEPIYLEYVGGRRGSVFAKDQGGYHSKDVIGDNWMFFDYKNYGVSSFYSNDCGRYYWDRAPASDDQLILINSNPNNTSIHTRAMLLNPMAFNTPEIKDFTVGSVIPSNTSITTQFSGGILSFDMAEIFPLKPRTGAGFYKTTDLVLGPFDRDIEVLTKNTITGVTTIFMDGKVASDYYYCFGIGGCDGVNSYWGSDGSIVKLLPSGKSLSLNVYSHLACTDTGSIDPLFATKIGVNSGAYLQFRARKNLRESTQVGGIDDPTWYPFNYDKNGMERKFDIHHTGGFGKLRGTYEFVTFAKSGKLYPIPDETDFLKYSTTDTSGNRHDLTVENYWKKYTLTGGNKVYSSGWRQGSRISFEFEEVEVLYDEFPYESHKIVIPSGTCTISGEMGYLGQADNCIFSEGFHLVDNTPNKVTVTGFYGPQFVSPVIQRIPVFGQPSGTFESPVLEAPSKMIQRDNKITIKNDQEYTKLLNAAPENYNKFDWAALSDLKVLNDEETIEALPPDDGNTFLNSQILICAAQGQKLADGTHNPDGKKVYDVKAQFQTYDSVATDAIINSGQFMTSHRGTVVRLVQPISGYLVAQGTTINNIKEGLL